MTKIKLHLNLQEADYYTSGIGQYERAIAIGLAQRPEFEVSGGVHRKILTTLPFPVVNTILPYHYCFEPKYSRWIPCSYNMAMNTTAECCIFFANRIPAMKIKGKIIAVLHDLIPLHVEMEDPSIKEHFRQQCLRILKRADAICTVSEFSRCDIATYFDYPIDRIFIVPPGVNIDHFKQRTNSGNSRVRKKYCLPEHYLLYFGSSRPYKNVSTLLRAYALLPKNQQNTVGLVISQQSDALQHLAEDLGIARHIHWLGNVPEEDKAAIFCCAEAFVILSHYEGFGIPLLEAMAAGIPIICSDCASLPEVAGDAGIIIPADDAEIVYQKIKQLFDDHTLREKLIQRGAKRCESFQWSNSIEKMADVIFKVREL